MAISNSVQQPDDQSAGRSLAFRITLLVVFAFSLVGASIGYVFFLIAAMPNAERAYWAQAFAGLLGAAATTYAVYFAANANERLRRAEKKDREKDRAKRVSILCGLFQEELYDSACRLYDAELYFAEVFEPDRKSVV